MAAASTTKIQRCPQDIQWQSSSQGQMAVVQESLPKVSEPGPPCGDAGRSGQDDGWLSWQTGNRTLRPNHHEHCKLHILFHVILKYTPYNKLVISCNSITKRNHKNEKPTMTLYLLPLL